MTTNRFKTVDSTGRDKLTTAIATSTGATDANKIIATDSTGRIDSSFMPVGIGAETETIVVSEALTAGDFINIYNNAGTRTARKAGADTARTAHGFVLANVSNGQNATVYKTGTNTALTGLTHGAEQYLGTNGGVTTTPNISSAGYILQCLGYASDSTEIIFNYQAPTVIG